MEFPEKTELQTNIHKLVQEYKKSISKVKELTQINDLLTSENIHIKEILRDQNERDLKVLNAQEGLIPHVITIKRKYEELQNDYQNLQKEKERCIQHQDSEAYKCLEMHKTEIQNMRTYYENLLQREKDCGLLKEATLIMDFDEEKTQHQQIKCQYEEKLQEVEFALHQQRSENINIKSEFRAKDMEIQDLKEQIRQLNDSLRISKEKYIAIESKYNPGRYSNISSSYKNTLLTNYQKYDPLEIRQGNLKEQMSKIEYIDVDSYESGQKLNENLHTNKTYLFEEKKQTVPKPKKSSLIEPFPHEIPSFVISVSKKKNDSRNDTSSSSTANTSKPKKRKLINPNDYSSQNMKYT